MKNSKESVQKEHRQNRRMYDSGSHYGNAVYGSYGVAAYGGNAADDQIDIMRLNLIGLRRWKTILLIAVLVVGLGFIYLHFATPIYRTSALMEMSVRRPRLVKESAAVIEDASSGDQDVIFNTRLAKFQSLSMRERVAESYLSKDTAASNSVVSLAGMLGAITSWSVQKNTFIVEVKVEHSDPFLRKPLRTYMPIVQRA